jgi:hypothetical protein
MATHTLILDKMTVSPTNPVSYKLGDVISLNAILSKRLTIQSTGNIFCISCNRKITKTFADGLCFPCFRSSPLASECIIRPEKCEAHLGKGRDPEWEQQYHNQPHYVYLAVSSSLKVGVTQHLNIPTRWIDQGASSAIIIAKTPNRYLAGCIEVQLKKVVSDRTSWQKMLKNQLPHIDLESEKKRLRTFLSTELQSFVCDSTTHVEFSYPALHFPTQIKSLSLQKIPEISGLLIGIKGQYLIFESGHVFNVRKHTGYEVYLDVP